MTAASQSPRPHSTGRSGHSAGEVSGAAAFSESPLRPGHASPARTDAAGDGGGPSQPLRPGALVPVRSSRFAPEHPLSVILANQAVNAALYGDGDRIAAMRGEA
jgi:hypothetical protein